MQTTFAMSSALGQSGWASQLSSNRSNEDVELDGLQDKAVK